MASSVSGSERKKVDPDILIIEPFYCGSHKQLVDCLMRDEVIGPRVHLVTMSGKKWHWRARVSALHLSTAIPVDHHFRVLFSSSVLNLAELVALRSDLASLHKVLYFHENQLQYPVRKQKDRDFQYGYNQILSCLVADCVLFNSGFNMESFLTSINTFMKLMPDYRPKGLPDVLRPKCSVVYFPMQYPTSFHCQVNSGRHHAKRSENVQVSPPNQTLESKHKADTTSYTSDHDFVSQLQQENSCGVSNVQVCQMHCRDEIKIEADITDGRKSAALHSQPKVGRLDMQLHADRGDCSPEFHNTDRKFFVSEWGDCDSKLHTYQTDSHTATSMHSLESLATSTVHNVLDNEGSAFHTQSCGGMIGVNPEQQKSAVQWYKKDVAPCKTTGLQGEGNDECLHIVWPHRWEHDKDPETFFQAMFRLKDEGQRFLVSVLGETFTDVPDIFAEAERRLRDHIYTWGYQPDKSAYFRTLQHAHVVVSTSKHEFFGVAMLEAVYLGCYPLCPKSLVYPEIYPGECLYSTPNQLYKRLRSFCQRPHLARHSNVQMDLQKFSWDTLRPVYLSKLSINS